jgi:hypothetical protein
VVENKIVISSFELKKKMVSGGKIVGGGDENFSGKP